MKWKYYSLCIILFLLIPTVNRADEIDVLFDSLDVAVANCQKYVDLKEKDLTRLRQNYEVASVDLDKYLSSKQLIQAYLRFNSDSAIHYSNICLAYARKTKNKDWEAESRLYIALSSVMHGETQQAINIMDGMGEINLLPVSLRPLYAKTKLEIAVRMEDMCATRKAFYDNCLLTWNTYKDYLKPNSPERCYYEVFKSPLPDRALLSKVLSLLKKVGSTPSIEKSLYEQCALLIYDRNKSNSRKDSIAALKYAILSAITDIKIANRDESSMLYIVNRLEMTPTQTYKMMRRELDYVRVSAINVRLYRDFKRSLWLIVSQGFIHENNLAYTKKVQTRYNIAVIALSVLLLFSLITFFSFLRKVRKKHVVNLGKKEKQKKLLAQNDDYQTKVEALEKEVAELRDKIERRDKGYLDGILLNVNVISTIKEKMKKMQNLATAKKWSSVYSMLNDELLDNEEYKDISRSIDNIILTVIPDFVDRFNSLLKPEGQIKLEDPKVLTPGLRIYGLVALGLNDMGSIAEILHYSSQTIYNYRLKIKKTAIVPEKQFDDAVSELFK